MFPERWKLSVSGGEEGSHLPIPINESSILLLWLGSALIELRARSLAQLIIDNGKDSRLIS
jgi:hypothetical protein